MSYEFNWPIYGHQNQQKFLQQAIFQDKLANAYLFYGPAGLGKKTVAHLFAQSLFCSDKKLKPCGQCYNCRMIDNRTFANLEVLGKQADELSVENIRALLKKLSLSAVDNTRKVAMIFGVEHINLFSANALLKTLEEPPRGVTIILVADSIAALPATVMSRSQLLKFQSLSTVDMKNWLENYNFSATEKETIINLSFGRPGLALDLMGDDLANFKKTGNFIIKLLSSSTFYYMQAIDKWFEVLKKENPGFKVYELGNLTKRYLDLFEVFLRDILWIKFDRPIANQMYEAELKEIAQNFSVDSLVQNLLVFNKAKQKLKYNISPQLLWENLLLNIK